MSPPFRPLGYLTVDCGCPIGVLMARPSVPHRPAESGNDVRDVHYGLASPASRRQVQVCLGASECRSPPVVGHRWRMLGPERLAPEQALSKFEKVLSEVARLHESLMGRS